MIPLIVPLAYVLGILQHASWNFLAATVVPALLPEDINPFVLLFVVMPVKEIGARYVNYYGGEGQRFAA